MRHELLLTAALLVVLVAELFSHPDKKGPIITLSVVCFGIITALGFIPSPEGELFGGMYVASGSRLMMKNILNIGVLLVILQSVDWLRRGENSDKTSEYFILLVSTLIGMNFMISSGHFLMFYIGLELATIPIAALAAFDKYRNNSAEAGIKLILISALSSGILLYGLSMIYGTTGTFYFNEIAAVFSDSNLQILGFIFFFTGMAFKISIVPFHLWTADVYEGAPINITAYLSVISKGAAIFIFIIVLFTVFPVIVGTWQKAIYLLSILTMTIGNLFAIRQQNLKRFLAFSSISQAGYILLGFVGGNQLGMASVIYYVLVYIFSNLGAFGVVLAVSNASGKENIDDYNGLYHTNPKLSLIMMLALFSLAGIPPVAGYFGKFFLFTAAAEKGFFTLVIIAVLNTIISLYYYLLIVKAMFLLKSETPVEKFRSTLYTRFALGLCVAGIIVTGFASTLFEFIRNLSFGV
ncbi:MAG TPA: NADH-quinone oxidoreductase subunit N [Bacteroidales bacterium]|nr:NADH-quinone oxidoreductase subunit N [Bacteroidales bacterium]HBH82948.1 NADH-quinone oxidoreductase subunit N [Bacteroidales bacterium]HBQ83384.1 NADH-quinone oxidoreductase subunit N [Bacteroidales bacterium]HCU18507.1 NADH-quinone oxidoreductase subunit N [Bacteroidales bacterium]